MKPKYNLGDEVCIRNNKTLFIVYDIDCVEVNEVRYKLVAAHITSTNTTDWILESHLTPYNQKQLVPKFKWGDCVINEKGTKCYIYETILTKNKIYYTVCDDLERINAMTTYVKEEDLELVSNIKKIAEDILKSNQLLNFSGRNVISDELRIKILDLAKHVFNKTTD